MSSAFLAQLPYIGSSATLGWQRDDVAQSYMEHILQRARVLLPRRGWRVGLIKEFYPRGASLLGLNVNAGSEVCIRFRIPGKKNEFLPFHEVLCTALHEFTHCVYSKHDRSFWNLYYELVKECELLEVAMIQQGKQLYPDIAQILATSSSVAHPKSRAAMSGVTASPSGNRKSRGYRIGRADGGQRPQAGTHTRQTTKSVTKAPSTLSTGVSSPAGSTTVFSGEGRRLGGGDPHQSRTPVCLTPTRDALRKILADAAERRLRQEQFLASVVMPTSEPVVQQPYKGIVSHGNSEMSEMDEANVPDRVPQCRLDDKDGGFWNCPRCGFLNCEKSVIGCSFCADCDDSDETENTVGKRARVEGGDSSSLMDTDLLSSTSVSRPVLGKEGQVLPQEATPREYCVVSSDDDSN